MTNKDTSKDFLLLTKNQAAKTATIRSFIDDEYSDVVAWPGWALIMILGCIKHEKIAVSFLDTNMGIQQFTVNVYEAGMFIKHAGQTPQRKQKDLQKSLTRYLEAYRYDKVPIEHYKTFEKSMAKTIEFLEAMEEEKGRRFTIDRTLSCYPLRDVRLFTDLVYLQQKGLIDLPELDNLMIKDDYVDKLEVNLLVSTANMSTALTVSRPDAEYLGLQFYYNDKKLIYKGNIISGIRVESKACKLLEEMMKETSLSLYEARNVTNVESNIRDKTGRNRIENIITTANKHLKKLKFTHKLGFADSEIIWEKR